MATKPPRIAMTAMAATGKLGFPLEWVVLVEPAVGEGMT
jgi:hypothetical protein